MHDTKKPQTPQDDESPILGRASLAATDGPTGIVHALRALVKRTEGLAEQVERDYSTPSGTPGDGDKEPLLTRASFVAKYGPSGFGQLLKNEKKK